MSKGLDLIMAMDVNNNWIRYSEREARRKTDYEKYLEKKIQELERELDIQKKRTLLDFIFRK